MHRLIFVIVTLFCLSACSDEDKPTYPKLDLNKEINKEWSVTISPYLVEPLWESIHNYDAVNALMIPMHYAHKQASSEPSKLEQFDDFFYRFYVNFEDNVDTNRLRRVYFYYLYLKHLKGKIKHGLPVLPHDLELLRKITSISHVHWREELVGNFAESPVFFKGIYERLVWKSEQINTVFEYHKAFVDEELLLMATGAILTYISENIPQEIKANFDDIEFVNKIGHDISNNAMPLFISQGEFTQEGYWTLQPGVFYDFPDYEYAGNPIIEEGIAKALVPGIWVDSSHAHRTHEYLQDFIDISTTQNHKNYFTEALAGLVKNFDERILVGLSSEFNGLRMHNYSNGYNGVYRYNYTTTPTGYDMYEISGTLLLGWYGLLPSEKLKSGYMDMVLHSFPLEPNVLKTYIGPNTTRERLEWVQWPNYFENGFARLNLLTSIALQND